MEEAPNPIGLAVGHRGCSRASPLVVSVLSANRKLRARRRKMMERSEREISQPRDSFSGQTPLSVRSVLLLLVIATVR